jgi:hypothetical protein
MPVQIDMPQTCTLANTPLSAPSAPSAPSVPSASLQSPILSVVDIQGTWREEKTKTLWKVDGIVAQKHKQRSKAVVLSDSSNGVEWGMGNLMGSIEDGLLVWRNKNGNVMYEWERPTGPEGLDSPDAPLTSTSAQEPKNCAPPLRSKSKAAALKRKPEEHASPRSTSSNASTAPTETKPYVAPTGNGVPRGPATNLDKVKTNKHSTQEVSKLLEMAGSRLAAGDYGTAMQYVLFAQSLQ